MRTRTMQDVTGPGFLEVVISEDGKTVWINAEGFCILRACKINHLTVDDHRQLSKPWPPPQVEGTLRLQQYDSEGRERETVDTTDQEHANEIVALWEKDGYRVRVLNTATGVTTYESANLDTGGR